MPQGLVLRYADPPTVFSNLYLMFKTWINKDFLHHILHYASIKRSSERESEKCHLTSGFVPFLHSPHPCKFSGQGWMGPSELMIASYVVWPWQILHFYRCKHKVCPPENLKAKKKNKIGPCSYRLLTFLHPYVCVWDRKKIFCAKT